jgi:hypothetical protein
MHTEFNKNTLAFASLVDTIMFSTSFSFTNLSHVNMSRAQCQSTCDLSRVLSIHNATLPQDTKFGLVAGVLLGPANPPLIQNGQIRCRNQSISKWTVEPPGHPPISVQPHPVDKEKCVLLPIDKNSGTKISQRVDLRAYEELIADGDALAWLGARIGGELIVDYVQMDSSFAIKVREAGYTGGDLYTNWKVKQHRLHKATRNFEITFGFPKNVDNVERWMEYIELKIDPFIETP